MKSAALTIGMFLYVSVAHAHDVGPNLMMTCVSSQNETSVEVYQLSDFATHAPWNSLSARVAVKTEMMVEGKKRIRNYKYSMASIQNVKKEKLTPKSALKITFSSRGTNFGDLEMPARMGKSVKARLNLEGLEANNSLQCVLQKDPQVKAVN